jgi:thiamine-phosphate pyrophosphorylase
VAEAEPRCRLIIAVEGSADGCEQLAVTLGVGDIASVLIHPAAGQGLDVPSTRRLVHQAQQAGAAALILADARLTRDVRADGVHLPAGSSLDDYKQARGVLGNGFIIGADAGRLRDTAMRFGEAGADYVGFGIPDFVTDKDTARQRRLDLIAWWAEIFEVPCVALDVASVSEAHELARAGADFVAVQLPGSSSSETTRQAVTSFIAALASAPVT